MTLILAPYTRPPTDKPVGVVLDTRTVVGEWVGRMWNDIPKRAVLYVNDAPTLRPMYDAGELEAIYWAKPGRLRKLSSWRWDHPDRHRHSIFILQGTLSKVPVEHRLAAVLAVIDKIREWGAAPASPVGMLNALQRISMTSTFRESSANAPGEYLWRGSRIERGKHFAVEYGPTDIWDMRSAFPRALTEVSIPTRWRRYKAGKDLPEVESGFCHARVNVPWYMYGPLPDVWLANPTFPVETKLSGIWSLDELRIAQATGCEISPREYWVGNTSTQPFAEWGRMIDELRASVPESSVKIVKMAANRYVGRFAMDGHRERSRMVNGELEWVVEKGHRRPESLTVHGLVTADVRSTMFVEGIWPYPAHFIFCHTDGVALMTDASIDARPPPSKRWRVKTFMERLLLLNPQRYAYRPGPEDPAPWRYVVAGVPEEVAEPFFLRRWGKLSRDRG